MLQGELIHCDTQHHVAGNERLQEAAVTGRLGELIEVVRNEDVPESAPTPPAPTTTDVTALESIVCEPDPLFAVVLKMRDPVDGVTIKDR